MTQLRALVGRYLGRLMSQRTILVAACAGVLALLAGGALVANVVASRGGTPLEQAAKFRLLAWSVRGSGLFEQLMLVLAILLGSTQISSDLRQGTLFSVLARPVSRSSIFVSGWVASALLLAGLESVRALAWIGGGVFVGAPIDVELFAGISGFVMRDWLLLAMFAALGAALPLAYAIASGIGALFLSGFALREGTPQVLDWIGSALPLYGRQDVFDRAAIGEPISLGVAGEALLYHAAWIAVLLWAGAARFERRDLTPRT